MARISLWKKPTSHVNISAFTLSVIVLLKFRAYISDNVHTGIYGNGVAHVSHQAKFW